ncbi:aromatic ring-hydroxylating dioxygenase subunit alpha [Hoeflea sp. TYP-13]|uniref:aromatic ring-hydroxylating dioxygenase subunit alpha n=1 Tax=Hoeflea sp. TYP-13 TaxID=3230023 RepID=UPI0034C6B072
MNREEEIGLLDELLGLRKRNSAYLDEAVTYSPMSRYLDADRFAQEREYVFRRHPSLIAHVSELPEDGSFLRRDVAGTSVLLTRDRDGEFHAFHNICRHRGAQLVDAHGGCRHRFTCPYHAWTWDNTGRLIAVPHQEQGFPDLDKESYGLKPIACAVRFGFVWIQLSAQDDIEIGAHLAPLADDLEWLKLDGHQVFTTREQVWHCNWKVVIEGGLEAYHFRVAHAKTIAGMFLDNLSSYQLFGPHIRSVLARSTIDELVEQPRKDWKIRDYTNIVYNVFPGSVFLVQGDHVVLVHFEPQAIDRTLIRCVTLIPKPDEPLTDKAKGYWQANHDLTVATLDEDFALGESIQKGLDQGVNEAMTYGRFEGALNRINAEIERVLSQT